MKSIFAALLILGVLPLAQASDKHAKTHTNGTIMKVERYDAPQMLTGSNPSDAPLPDPETYDYDVSVRVNCGIYVGRYETWYDYLPSDLSPNRKVQVWLTRGAMYVGAPNQRQLELRIVSRHVDRGSCNANPPAIAAGFVSQ